MCVLHGLPLNMSRNILAGILGAALVAPGFSIQPEREPCSAASAAAPAPVSQVVVPRGSFYFVGREFADGMFQPFGEGFIPPDADADILIRIRCLGIQLDERNRRVGLELAVRHYLKTHPTNPFAGVTGPTMFDGLGESTELPPGDAVAGPLIWTRREVAPGVDWWEPDLGARLGRTDGKMVICEAKERGCTEERFRIHPAWALFRWMFSPDGKDVVPMPERE